MALQAETLVEEWFNRNGYFTIRGIKVKNDEIDILAIKNLGHGWDCVHCEVQVSIRPVTYISKLTSQLVTELGVKTSSSAKLRTEPQIASCAKQWVVNKYTAQKKQRLREQLNSNNSWRYLFVHGNVKDPKELAYIASEGVELLSFIQILKDLCTKQTHLDFAGSSAGDLVEIINFIHN
ncbi:hypothetical protein [Cytobacillus oceanisediminis]|uniref:hypothetical protein n=1 Tax=Cytobacillus oceanisediminis TaxID=665099 RepID=UPI00203C0B31|nr:hypothetical protein [Cytobacillus oceanisediminis]MCM3392581.1 hypothetical protein [Cytobacillus oceanisediminis]